MSYAFVRESALDSEGNAAEGCGVAENVVGASEATATNFAVEYALASASGIACIGQVGVYLCEVVGATVCRRAGCDCSFARCLVAAWGYQSRGNSRAMSASGVTIEIWSVSEIVKGVSVGDCGAETAISNEKGT